MREYCKGCISDELTCKKCIDGCNRKPAAFKDEKEVAKSIKKRDYIPYNFSSCMKESIMKNIDWRVQEVEFEQKSDYDYPRLKALVEGTIHKVPYPLNPTIIRDRMEAQLNDLDTFGPKIPKIKDVIFNPPATIVFWTDGSKTVVKAENELFDPEKGLAMAFLKKSLGNKGNYFNEVKKWTEKFVPATLVDIPEDAPYRIWFMVDGEVGVLPMTYKHKSSANRRAKTWFINEPNVEWVVSKTHPWEEGSDEA